MLLGLLGFLLLAAEPAAITIDYPAPGTVFPPDLAAPPFHFRDASGADAWNIEIAFAAGGRPLRLAARTEPFRLGPIDERCVASNNERPELTQRQKATRTWTPDEAAWSAITRSAPEREITLTITGRAGGKEVSRGRVAFSISRDPVGAPIFFRDVPLMPAELKKGVIKPLPKPALPLVAWRLRYVNETSSRLMVDNLPTCMNCHSFSRDGKTMGLDVDGPANDKGLYALVNLQKESSIRKEDVVAWSSFRGKLTGETRVGFMSQVSPDAQYVVTMVKGQDVMPGVPKTYTGNFYVANFKDYRFLQVFYPTSGILAWYSRATGKLQPLPGADDPKYVHTNAVWSPDGKYLVFARAEAREPYPAGGKLAESANSEDETQIRYDLYRIPFNEGRGGTPEAIRGASANGMSNSFPKISPDGRWIVYVQARNGLLMRPDSRLFIVPAAGGEARALASNMERMNSWHSFSPNGRWLVFSSKSRSPYTQMYLTHIDEQGRATPPVLIENATAANRAVNLPEFVNVSAGGWEKLDAPATDFYRISDAALDLQQDGRIEQAIVEWRKALELDPRDPTAISNLGAALDAAGRVEEAEAHYRQALEIDEEHSRAHTSLGSLLAKTGRLEAAVAELQRSLELDANNALAHSALGGVLLNLGRMEEGAGHLRQALELDPRNSDAHNNLGGLLARAGRFDEAIPHFEQAMQTEPESFAVHFNLGRALAAAGRLEEGIRLVQKATLLQGGELALVHDRLATLYERAGRWDEALAAARKALELATREGERELAESLRPRIALYESRAKQ